MGCIGEGGGGGSSSCRVGRRRRPLPILSPLLALSQWVGWMAGNLTERGEGRKRGELCYRGHFLNCRVFGGRREVAETSWRKKTFHAFSLQHPLFPFPLLSAQCPDGQKIVAL